MADIQSITVTSTQTVTVPKPHTTYTIQVATPTRTWTVSRRYNDFGALHAELVSSTGKEPPAALPPKHHWKLTRSAYDQNIIRERRVLLEAYLRAILNHRDSRWRQTYTFPDFLGYPAPSKGGSSSQPDTFTPSSWLIEHSSIQSLLRHTRSSMLKRDALAGMGDAAGSRGAGVEAKKTLREVGERVDGLERALVGMKGLGEGERGRREEMVQGLKSERGDLQRMAEAGVRTTLVPRDSASPSFRSTGNGNGTMPGGSGSLFVATGGNAGGGGVSAGRVFGRTAAPQETEDTRPLDDRGLVQLQQHQIDHQDDQLRELSRLLQKQRHMGEEIHQEVGEQNELLDDVERGVDKTGAKLQRTKRQLNRLQ